jgi:peroxiredoxin
MRALHLLVLAAFALSCDRAPRATTTRAALARPPTEASAADPALDDGLVGTTPTVWKTEAWLNSEPLALTDLAGKVVLVRWFMDPSCPYCSATAPSLEKLHRTYAARGLVVVGMYHHHRETSIADDRYRAWMQGYGFTFPVARDPAWQTLHAWWLDGGARAFSSAAFLLDRRGRVRGVHPGPRFAPGDADYEAIRRGVEVLLAEG